VHCELYNAALQERIEAYQKVRKSISYYDQQNDLPVLAIETNRIVGVSKGIREEKLYGHDKNKQAYYE